MGHITPHYRTFIELSPFVTLATSGPEGLDCSPRGDLAGFVRVHDETTLMLPDRLGNNRVDSLRNIVRDPRAAIDAKRIADAGYQEQQGRARLTTDASLLASFAIADKTPRSVIVLSVQAVYFQCARALARSDLWNPAKYVDPKALPSAGQILAALSENRVGGEDYDRAWPERAKQTLW